MGRTWLIRGTVAVVFAVLVGAWGVGVSGLRDSPSPSEERPPASPDKSIAPEFDSSVVRENKSDGTGRRIGPRTRAPSRSSTPATYRRVMLPLAPAPETSDDPPPIPRTGHRGRRIRPRRPLRATHRVSHPTSAPIYLDHRLRPGPHRS